MAAALAVLRRCTTHDPSSTAGAVGQLSTTGYRVLSRRNLTLTALVSRSYATPARATSGTSSRTKASRHRQMSGTAPQLVEIRVGLGVPQAAAHGLNYGPEQGCGEGSARSVRSLCGPLRLCQRRPPCACTHHRCQWHLLAIRGICRAAGRCQGRGRHDPTPDSGLETLYGFTISTGCASWVPCVVICLGYELGVSPAARLRSIRTQFKRVWGSAV